MDAKAAYEQAIKRLGRDGNIAAFREAESQYVRAYIRDSGQELTPLDVPLPPVIHLPRTGWLARNLRDLRELLDELREWRWLRARRSERHRRDAGR